MDIIMNRANRIGTFFILTFLHACTPGRTGHGVDSGRGVDIMDAELVEACLADASKRMNISVSYLGMLGASQTRGLTPVYYPATWQIVDLQNGLRADGKTTALITNDDVLLRFSLHRHDDCTGVCVRGSSGLVYQIEQLTDDTRFMKVFGCTVQQFLTTIDETIVFKGSDRRRTWVKY